jgi:hypothetical protein
VEPEHQIDEALQAAKATDREKLANVIHHLRAARNMVVIQVTVRCSPFEPTKVLALEPVGGCRGPNPVQAAGGRPASS